MPDIQLLTDEPANKLIFGINCYVSTEDAAVKLASEPGEKGWGSTRSLVQKCIQNY